MDIEPIWRYVVARQNILLKRKAGLPPPWTDDPILSRYSFCNVYREDDRTTIWCKEHVRDKYADSPLDELAIAIMTFRWFNRMDTGNVIFDYPPQGFEEYLKTGNPNFIKLMIQINLGEGPYFTGAYIIRSENGMSKLDGVIKHIPIAHKILKDMLSGSTNPRCSYVFDHLLGIPFIGKFMAAQLIADFKYTNLLRGASDWYSFVASGPGSRRGLNIVMGREPEVRWNEHAWKLALNDLRLALRPKFDAVGWEVPHNQDVQNMCCEFFKYSRGFSRNKYEARI